MSIKLEHVNYVYSEGTAYEKRALKDVNLEIPQGQFVGIIGHTGSGKSTLIQHLNGLIKATSGTVYYDGRSIYEEGYDMRKLRGQVGLVFQYPEYQLFEETSRRDIAFGPRNMGLDGDEVERRVLRAADFAGVDGSLLEHSPLELSGGQKRRVAIAGVIAMEPEVLILDEPTAGLDPAGRESLLKNILRYRDETGAAVVLVSHSMDDVARVADRLAVFRSGRIAMTGTPGEIFRRQGELEDMGLDVPAAAKIAAKLRARGVAVPEGIYTLEGLRAAICAIKEGRPC